MSAPSVNGPLSRQVMAYQQTIIMRNKTVPTLAALQYAYVATVYQETLAADGQAQALRAAEAMLGELYPAEADLSERIKVLAKTNGVGEADKLSPPATRVLTKYSQRYRQDGHTLVWSGTVPPGPGKWTQANPKPPVTPRAGEWRRWNVKQPITVPSPPLFGSDEDRKQIQITQQAVAARNAQDINTIIFWSGPPGSATLAGIWQNQLFQTLRPYLAEGSLKADLEYALVQKRLAQTLSDAFMESWKTKYTYWTARPNMRLPGLPTAIDNPDSPGYVSAQAAVSKAAADTLGIQLPAFADKWQSMALEAQNASLVAGVHFEADNTAGLVLGAAVAKQTALNLSLQPVIQ